MLQHFDEFRVDKIKRLQYLQNYFGKEVNENFSHSLEEKK